MINTFGQYIKELRIEKGMTLAELSAHLNIHTTNLSKVENGKREFDMKRLPVLCEIFKLEISDMQKELLSEKFAKSVCENDLDANVLTLAEQKVKYFSKAKNGKAIKLSKNDEPLPNYQDNADWRTKQFSKPDALVKVATLFSGIGAAEYAFKRLNLNHKIIFAGDIDPHVKMSYFGNYHIAPEDWHDDVTKFSGKPYRNKVDILIGGSPCQTFSMVGKRSGLADIRGTLFYDFARIVDETKPNIFIYENVRGLTNQDNGKTWEIVQNVFKEIGYKFFSEILNSKDYGMPQNRERVFVVGFKDKNTEFKFPSPVRLEHKMQDFLEDYTDSKYYLKEKGIKFVTSSKNKVKRYTQINGDIMLCQKANQQFNWHGDFVFEPNYEKEYDEFIFNVNEVEEKYYLSDKVRDYVLAGGTKNFRTSTKTDLEIARPLLQTMHKMHRAGVDNYVTHDKGKIRKLTPTECLRLMGFRDDFKIVVSDTQMYRQAGNSIVVDVLIALLKQMDITKYVK